MYELATEISHIVESRVYSPDLREWLSVDPLVKMNPQSLVGMPGNWKAVEYASGDPVNLVDPTGFCAGCGADYSRGDRDKISEGGGGASLSDRADRYSREGNRTLELSRDMRGIESNFTDMAVAVGAYLLTRRAGPAVSIDHKSMARHGIENFLGPESRVITNSVGDKVFMSKDGLRRVRFDINRPAPHKNPHAHIENLVNGKWRKSGPIYPRDVFPE